MVRKKILDSVPKVAFAPIHDGKFEFTPFPSCLKAVVRFLGHEVGYPYLLATSGAVFRLVWHSERWEGGNVDIVFMDKDPLKPFRGALDATGYTYNIMFNAN